MNSSLSWNDVVNPVFWLATRAKRMILPSRTCLVTMAIDTDMGYWPRHFFFFFFFFTCKIDRNERKKRNLPNNHIHLTLPQYPYIPGTSQLRSETGGFVREGQWEGSRPPDHTVSWAGYRDSIPVPQWGRQCAGPFTNHDLPGFFAYPARHRRE